MLVALLLELKLFPSISSSPQRLEHKDFITFHKVLI